tara:strand:+ start:2922 stop:4064 length:1143 start_codon:yes stop_codon:yes gene_type:complete
MVETSAIGHMSEPIEIHIYEKKLIKEKKNYIDIYFREKNIVNQFLWSKWKKILSVKSDHKFFRFFFKIIFLEALKRNNQKFLIPFRHHTKYLNDKNKNFFQWQIHDIFDLLDKHQKIIQFKNHEIDKGIKELSRYNINENDQIILLCVRDPVYRLKLRNNYLDKKDIIYSNRDSRIGEFEHLVKYLCEKNYKVIRMGQLVHEKINYNHPNLFDYAFDNKKSDFLDLYLFYISKFVISTGTGLDALSSLFRKKRIYINCGEFSSFNYKLNNNISYVFPKKIIKKSDKKELGLLEIFEENINQIETKNDKKYNDFTFKSLDSDEMIDAFETMENFIKEGYSKNYLFKNQRINEYLREKYKTNTKIYWSPKYLYDAYNKLFEE